MNNVKQGDISVNDRLALFGYGLFETLLITEKGVRFSYLHWERMSASAMFLKLPSPTWDEWTLLLQDFLDKITGNNYPFALRVTLSGGNPSLDISPQFFINVRSIPYTQHQYLYGINLTVLPYPLNERSTLSGIKSTNYLENILAKQEAISTGADEGLWLNTQGQVAEGTTSNIFWIKEGVLFTPSLCSGCLAGTRRTIILKLAQKMAVKIQVGEYSLLQLMDAEEVFLTNSLMGIMPVAKIGDIPFAVAPMGDDSSLARCLEYVYGEILESINGCE